MALRPLSQRATIGGVVATLGAAAVAVLAVALKEPGAALGVLLLVILAFVLWLLASIRRDSAAPLTVDLEGDHARYEFHGMISHRRVRILNRSGSTVRGVRVQFERCEQQQIYQVLLQRIHSEPHPLDLDPDAYAYFDLVRLPKGSDHYGLGYSEGSVAEGTSDAVMVQPLDLVISVTAVDTKRSLHGFAVSVKDGALHVLPH